MSAGHWFVRLYESPLPYQSYDQAHVSWLLVCATLYRHHIIWGKKNLQASFRLSPFFYSAENKLASKFVLHLNEQVSKGSQMMTALYMLTAAYIPVYAAVACLSFATGRSFQSTVTTVNYSHVNSTSTHRNTSANTILEHSEHPAPGTGCRRPQLGGISWAKFCAKMLRSLLAGWRASWQAAATEDALFWREPPREDSEVTEVGYGRRRDTSGAINEKTVLGTVKATNLAPLLHASFGLDHYPNYLNRWQGPAITQLEERLEDQLALVRAQKELAQQRCEAVRGFNHCIHPRKLEDVFDDRFLATLDPEGMPRPSLLAKLLTEECDGVFSFPLLRAQFCSDILVSGENYEDFIANNHLSNLIGNDRPKMLDLMKMSWLNDMLLLHVINPVAQLTMQDQLLGDALDFRHGYLVGYSPLQEQHDTTTEDIAKEEEEEAHSEGGRGRGRGGRREQPRYNRDHLVAHSDDSEATLNVGLCVDYQGGDLVFYGARGTGKEGTALTRFRHLEMGHAVLHSGRQLHEVLPVTSGNRCGLIVWARSVEGVRQGICPCCWINGRDAFDSACICGPSWN